MASTPLTSFLVELKFGVDKTSEGVFSGSLSKASVGVMALGAAVIGASLKIGKFEANLVESMAKAKIAINSLGISSLGHFRAMQQAAERVGIAGEDMVGSFEKIKQMKFDIGPGATSLFKLMNPNISEKDDASQILEKMGIGARKMKEQGISSMEISARAQASGMDPRMARIMAEQGPEWQSQLEQFKKENTNWDGKTPQTAKEIADQRAHNNAKLFNKGLETKYSDKMIDGYKKGSDDIAKMIENGTDEQIIGAIIMQEILGINLEMSKTLLNMGKDIALEIGPVFDNILGVRIGSTNEILNRIATSLANIEHPIDTLLNAMGIVGSAGIAMKAADWYKKGKDLFTKGGFGGRSAAGVTGRLGGLGLAGGSAVLGVAASGLAGYQIGELINEKYPTIGSDIYDLVNDKQTQGNLYKKFHSDKSIDTQVLDTLQESGVNFKTAVDMLANFKAESGMNPYALGDKGSAIGLGQWRGSRREDYRKLFGHSIESVEDTAKAIEEQAKFAAHEILAGKERSNWERALNSGESGSLYARYIERPKDKDGAARYRGDMAKGLEGEYSNVNHITIHVNGTGDPNSTANILREKMAPYTDSRYSQAYGG